MQIKEKEQEEFMPDNYKKNKLIFLFNPKRSNCFVWAIFMWLYGTGKIKVRKSINWKGGFHVYIETPEGLEISYIPKNKKGVSKLGGYLNPWFEGELEIKERDKK